jgi:hypothetical protein
MGIRHEALSGAAPRATAGALTSSGAGLRGGRQAALARQARRDG